MPVLIFLLSGRAETALSPVSLRKLSNLVELYLEIRHYDKLRYPVTMMDSIVFFGIVVQGNYVFAPVIAVTHTDLVCRSYAAF